MMDTCLANAPAIIENDRRTLDWVRNKAATIPSLHSLFASADESMRRFDSRFGTNSYLTWSVLHESGDGSVLRLHVGGLIQLLDNVIDNVSYCLCVADDEKKRVLRKYHFDYANRAVRGARRSATFHLQYGGKPLPQMGAEYDHDHMDGWLEEPRMFFLPMSLSLVLHMAFREFPDEYTNRLCEEGEWRSIHVHRDQTCLIVPFLDKCLNIANDANKKLLWDAACEPA